MDDYQVGVLEGRQDFIENEGSYTSEVGIKCMIYTKNDLTTFLVICNKVIIIIEL